jgi:hypothetical protein
MPSLQLKPRKQGRNEMITLEQAHEHGHTSFPIVANPGEEQTLGDWIKANTYLRKSVVADHVAERIVASKVAPKNIAAVVYHCYRPQAESDLAGMFMIEVKRIGNDSPAEILDHITIRTMMVDGKEYIVFGTDYDIKTIDMSEFSKENAATLDDLRMWMSVYRGDGEQGEVLFRQLRDFLKLHNLTPQQVEFVRGNALRHPREGRGGLIKLDMRPKNVNDMVLATLRFETSFLVFDQRQILEAEGFSIEATRLLYEMNTPPTPTDTEAQTEQPAQEAEMVLEENKATVNDTKADEAAPQQPRQEAPRAQPEQKKEEPAPVLVALEGGGPVPLEYALEWLEGLSVQRADREYFKELLEKVCKTHDVEPELVHFAFAPVKHASLLGTKNTHSDELSSELGLVDTAVLVPVVGKPLGMMQLGSLLTFTTTAEWETHVRIGSEPKQVEKLLYLTDPTLRQTQYLAVNRVDSLNFGASALMVLTNTVSAREVEYIERLWNDIQRRYTFNRDLDRRLASQVVIKFERIISPSLRSNHTLERGHIKGYVYSPGADSKLLFGFDVYTELESIDQGKLSECIGAFEVEMPKMGPAPVFEPLSARTKAMGGKSVDVGSAANPIPDTEAPKTDPATLNFGDRKEAQELRYAETPYGIIGFTEFKVWLHKNLAGDVQINVTNTMASLKITESCFFEMKSVKHAAIPKEHNWITGTPGRIDVRAVGPDIFGPEARFTLKTEVRPTHDPKQYVERVTEIVVASKYETPTSKKSIKAFGESETIRQPVIVRQNWKEGPKVGEAPAVNMMQAGVSLRFIELFQDVVGFEEFGHWLDSNVHEVLQFMEKRITKYHFFEIVRQERPVMGARDTRPEHVKPGVYVVRAFDPARANSEVMFQLRSVVVESTDPMVWQERIIQIALAGSPEVKTPPAPPAVLDQTTLIDTNLWIFFNLAMGGITELLSNDDDKDRVRDAVRYIDGLYHCKGENTERYEAMYDPSRGVLNMTVVEKRNNKKVVEIELQVV